MAGTTVAVRQLSPERAGSVHSGAATGGTAPSSADPGFDTSFSAKLSSTDIPEEGGGVRTGGCSGALIAGGWIITAGHCFHDTRDNRVDGRPEYHMKVALGKRADSDPHGHVTQVVDVRQSPYSDLALARLENPVTDITPLSLPGEAPTVGQRATFVGWGALSSKVIVQSDHLKRGDFAVHSVGQYEIDLAPVHERTVENSPCPDDSGSPYFVPGERGHKVLIAIEDRGPDCPNPGLETAARVDSIRSWIQQQLDS
ncbi:esterase [Amycolatopsis panacis]|uniref:Esterase n=1 Tax=Amycolatopsis panacis TaxID=2340917 RepID=A0A419I497_9PSEU|nr:esterase [Amycolatopsis panacis]